MDVEMDFRRAVTDAATALSTLAGAPFECARNARTAFSGTVSAIVATLREADALWTKYEEADEQDACGRTHAKITAKFRMAEERASKFEATFRKAVEESEALRGNIGYLRKRVAMAYAAFPKTPRRIEPRQPSLLDAAPERPAEEPQERPARPAEPARDAQWEAEELFTRRISEFRVACANFVNSYEKREWETGAVGMVNSAGRNAKHVEDMWRNYLVSGMEIQVVGLHQSIGKYLKSIAAFLDMAWAICREFHREERYASSLEYVGRKYDEFASAFPPECRKSPSEFGRRYAVGRKSLEEILDMCRKK